MNYHEIYRDQLWGLIEKYPMKHRWCITDTYRMHNKAISSYSNDVHSARLMNRINKARNQIEVPLGEQLAPDLQRYENLLSFCAATVNAVLFQHTGWYNEAEQCYQQCLIDLRKNDE